MPVSDEDEIVEEWYTTLENLTKQNNTQDGNEERFYRLYEIADGKYNNESLVKIYENEKAFVSEGTTGLLTWDVRKKKHYIDNGIL